MNARTGLPQENRGQGHWNDCGRFPIWLGVIVRHHMLKLPGVSMKVALPATMLSSSALSATK
jgi:hypothetical protein